MNYKSTEEMMVNAVDTVSWTGFISHPLRLNGTITNRDTYTRAVPDPRLPEGRLPRLPSGHRRFSEIPDTPASAFPGRSWGSRRARRLCECFSAAPTTRLNPYLTHSS